MLVSKKNMIILLVTIILLMPIAVSADRSKATESTAIVDTEDYEIEGFYTSNGKVVEVWIEGIEGMNGSSAHPIDVYVVTSDGMWDHSCSGWGDDDFTALYTKENLNPSALPFHFTYDVISDDSLYLLIDNCDNQKDTDYKDNMEAVKVTFAINDESDELAEDLGDAAAGLGMMMIGGIVVCCVLPFGILIFVIVRKKKPEVVHIQAAPQVVHQPAPMQQPTPPMQSPMGPTAQMAGVPDGQGYEWLDYEGRKYWRNAGSYSEWTLHQ